MKSSFGCPACGMPMEWAPYRIRGTFRLFCGSVHCHDEICGRGTVVETRFGQDSNDGYDRLKARFEKAKEKAEDL